jgi:hypothetical protein
MVFGGEHCMKLGGEGGIVAKFRVQKSTVFPTIFQSFSLHSSETLEPILRTIKNPIQNIISQFPNNRTKFKTIKTKRNFVNIYTFDISRILQENFERKQEKFTHFP